MGSRLPSLNALRAFEAAARHLSLTRAAEELHVTPAAVSHQIKALEAELGAPLLRRVNRGLALTDAGQAGLVDLRSGFSHLSRAVRSIRAQSGGAMLTLSAAPSFAATWLVPRLEGFKAAHPEIDLRLHASADLVDFDRDEVDVAVRFGLGDYPGLEVVRLSSEQIFPVCSPALVEGARPLRTPPDLAVHTLLHLDWTPRNGIYPDWQMWLRAAGFENLDHTRGPRFSDFGLALDAAVRGQGVALGSSTHAADHLAAGRLVAPFDLCMPAPFAYFLVCPPERAAQPMIAAFRDWIIGEAAQSTEAACARPGGRSAPPAQPWAGS